MTVERSLFLSSSIPSDEYQALHGVIDPLEITAAVVAIVRGAVMAGIGIVTATHPTIAPLILYVAQETRGLAGAATPPAIVFQSDLFREEIPDATQKLASDAGAPLVWTEAVPGERPVRGSWDGSLRVMRDQMLREPSILGAVFIGGMDGIRDEHELFRELRPNLPTFPLGAPGGAAASLVHAAPSELRDVLVSSRVYPAVIREILRYIRVT